MKVKLSGTLSSNNPATSAIREAPIVIVVCAEMEKSGYYKGAPATDKKEWFMFDVALAMQNLVLAAHSSGLGTVYVGYFDARKAAQLLELPQNIAVVAMTPLGYSDGEPKERPRKELSEIISYEKYGQQII